MCGVFGIICPEQSALKIKTTKSLIESLFTMSESRGREAAGLAFSHGGKIDVLKQAGAAKLLRKNSKFHELFKSNMKELSAGTGEIHGPFVIMGHSRLVTNGMESVVENNQPACKAGIVGLHNGIIVNDAELWAEKKELSRLYQVDTEIILSLVRQHLSNKCSVENAMQKTFAEIKGSASLALLFEDLDLTVLATNTGSLYWCNMKDDSVLFASEKYTLSTVLTENHLNKDNKIEKLEPGQGIIVNNQTGQITIFRLAESAEVEVPPKLQKTKTINLINSNQRSMIRCSKCILPETFPNIKFDEIGVCNYCHSYNARKPKGKEKLEETLSKYRKNNGEPDCIVAFSGGRDSSYGLHLVKKELGLNPIAFTFDWGMVTDIARRNQARMCSELGVELIIRAADIPQKRRNIRKNILAWLKRPDLGVIPLFMAGDKQFYYYARKLRKELNIDLVIFCAGNQYEQTNFKTGFCGIKEKDNQAVMTKISVANKLQLAAYYAKQFILNPRYLNSSLSDTLFAYYSSYMAKDDFLYLYHYLPWEENTVDDVLLNQYEWETDKNIDSTWRIGDGTASFYNYVYHTIAGFSEFDTFRSNQIRCGVISRAEALSKVEYENQPRFESIKEYAQLVGFNADEALNIINSVPRLYD